MIKKIRNYFKQKRDLKKAKQYYRLCQAGALFLKYIYDDIEKQKKDNVNRHQRRRIETHLKKTGRLNPEIVNTYYAQVTNILTYIETNRKKCKK